MAFRETFLLYARVYQSIFNLQAVRSGGAVSLKKPLHAKKHCQNVHICLIGANRFQNDLFVANLKKIHGCECNFIVPSCISRLPEHFWTEPDQQCVICLDCYGLNNVASQKLLSSVSEKILQRHTLALFNVPHNNGLEKMALSYGVRGFFYPDNSPDDFCRGIRGLLQGEVWLSRKILTSIILSDVSTFSNQFLEDAKKLEKLTPREKEILKLVATGAQNKEIASELFLSAHTIRVHLYNIYRKIEVRNRTKASTMASKHLSD